MPPYAGATLQQNDASCARHAHSNGYTTQIDGEHFTAFRTTSTKSRLNFLSLLRGSYQSYVLNDAAFEHLKKRKADPALVARLATRAPQLFPNQLQFLKHLVGRKINVFDKLLIRMLGEAGIWGSIRHHGLLGSAVIVSDDADQFRVGNHALCWIHAERLLQKLMPVTPEQARRVGMMRDLIWRFYKALKVFRQKPSPGSISAFGRRFDHIFTMRTGYQELDRLLARLYRRKHELLKVLERPETPLHTNASENDLRSFVTKRKISGSTMSCDGRVARELSFYHYLGDRLGVAGKTVPALSTLVLARA
jgi:hypothetical protein